MSVVDRIGKTLNAALAPASVKVVDESGKHKGHAGAIPGKTTHVRVVVVAEAFRGVSRIERHRRVNALLADEIAAGLHALAIETKAPGE
jgi:BolA protein